MRVKKIILEPTPRKDKGSWILNTQQVVPPGTLDIVEQAIVWLTPGKTAANHRHARSEALLGIGEALYFFWQDEEGTIYEEEMYPNGVLYLFLIPPNVPHAVINRSVDKPAFLYEYFDDIFRGIETVELVRELERS
jgi:uncharacterized RmlC-like cupin family protein